MKIGCSSWSFRDDFAGRALDLLGFVERAAELTLDGIEPLSRDFPSVSRRFLIELREQLARFPVDISAVSLSNDFAHPHASERRRQSDDVIQWTHICRDLDVGLIRTFTGHLRDGIAPEEAKGWVYECYGRVLAAAERAGVTFAVENHGNCMNTPEELVELVMHFGSASLQLNPDPTNFVPRHHEKTEAAREGVYTSLAKVARFAVHSHLTLATFDADGTPTNVDVPRLLAIYRKACYDGYLSIEYVGKDEPTKAVGRATHYLRELIDRQTPATGDGNGLL